ncbi:MAG TPA: TlpA disulfide reductase family protein [Parafilimonas sp.]|nr:TlpA disulfide reductase family protein [Parafilimonas sp.]
MQKKTHPVKLICINVCLLLLIGVNANANTLRQEQYVINGNIKGVDTGMIRMLSEDGNDILDSAIISKGQFTMKGEIKLPERRLFIINPGSWSFKAFVEDTIISLMIDTTGAVHYGKPGDSWALIWEIEQTGSKLSDIYALFKKETSEKYYVSILDSLRRKLKTAETDQSEDIKYQMDSIVNIISTKQKLWIESYIEQHPSSIAGLYIFNEFYQLNPKQTLGYLQSIVDKFSGSAKESVYYTQLTNTISGLQQILPNSIAPDFTLFNSNKIKFTFSSTTGYYTVIDFWASWCGPCRKAIPAWKKVYARYYNKGLRMVSVSSDANFKDWMQALKQEQMPWVQVIDEYSNENQPAKVAGLYSVSRLPFYVLVGGDGKVILSSNEDEVITKKIEEILK